MGLCRIQSPQFSEDEPETTASRSVQWSPGCYRWRFGGKGTTFGSTNNPLFDFYRRSTSYVTTVLRRHGNMSIFWKTRFVYHVYLQSNVARDSRCSVARPKA